MAVQVNTSTMCQCQYGANPLPLSAVGSVNAASTLALNIMDIPKGTFGIYNSPNNPAAVAVKAVGATHHAHPLFFRLCGFPVPPKSCCGTPLTLKVTAK